MASNPQIRFISKLGKRGMSFYKLLYKSDGFQWNEQVVAAFIVLKQYLKSANPGPAIAR
jgi:hypothetical protein